MQYKKPPRLKKGESIFLMAPATSMDFIERKRVDRGIAYLKSLGLNPVMSGKANVRYGNLAGSPEERAEELMKAFRDPEIQGIMTIMGGFNSNDLLEYLDFETIRAHPKVFIGFSDVTILNTALYEKAGLINFHGPAFVTFLRPKVLEYERDEFVDVVIRGTAPHMVRASPEYMDDPYWYKDDSVGEVRTNPGWQTIRGGSGEGELIGGNLGTLLALSGTTYWPNLEGKILFIEDDEEETPYSILRYLRQLRQMGVFKMIRGLMVGRISSEVGFDASYPLSRMLKEVLEGYQIPVVTGVDFGHTNPIMTIPIGIKAKLDADEQTLTYLESGVE